MDSVNPEFVPFGIKKNSVIELRLSSSTNPISASDLFPCGSGTKRSLFSFGIFLKFYEEKNRCVRV